MTIENGDKNGIMDNDTFKNAVNEIIEFGKKRINSVNIDLSDHYKSLFNELFSNHLAGGLSVGFSVPASEADHEAMKEFCHFLFPPDTKYLFPSGAVYLENIIAGNIDEVKNYINPKSEIKPKI